METLTILAVIYHLLMTTLIFVKLDDIHKRQKL